MIVTTLTQAQYREARERVAVYLTGGLHHEPEDLLRAEQLLDAGIIDLQALGITDERGRA